MRSELFTSKRKKIFISQQNSFFYEIFLCWIYSINSIIHKCINFIHLCIILTVYNKSE